MSANEVPKDIDEGNAEDAQPDMSANEVPKDTLASAIWKSALVPESIRRPWDVFADHVMKETESDDAVRELMVTTLTPLIETRGAFAAFSVQENELRQCCTETSLVELAAYVAWKCAKYPANNVPS